MLQERIVFNMKGAKKPKNFFLSATRHATAKGMTKLYISDAKQSCKAQSEANERVPGIPFPRSVNIGHFSFPLLLCKIVPVMP